MQLKELFEKLAEWRKTRSISTAAEICDGILADMSEAAKERYSEPVEPLIKDEKARKAVRAWAEAVGKSDTPIEFDESANSLWRNRSRIQFDGAEFKSLKNWQKYTIEELCGEEAE